MIWATEGQAQASKVMPVLSQLIKQANGNWKPDWNSVGTKHVIDVYNYRIKGRKSRYVRYFLAFKSKEVRNEFMKEHIALVLEAKELL